MRRRITRLAYITLPTALIMGGVHYTVNAMIEELVNVSVEFGGEADQQSSREDFLRNLSAQQQRLDDNEFVKLPKAAPFREIDAFDRDALDWSNFFDGYATQGILVFDANGDGRLDVYLTHNNNTWTRPTDEDSVLLDKPYISGNGLYLNLGNGSDGLPTFRQIKDLVRMTPAYAAEELVIEDFLYPRDGPEQSTDRVGRSSACAIAADLNNDSLVDLLVGNILPGMLWSSPETQRVLGQFVRPVGRQAVNTKVPLSALGLYFLKDYQPNDDRNDWRESARDREPMGANSVYLNLGDKDNDSIPEWKDVSREYGLEGSRKTMALLAADFDVDGDLDIFEANIMDMDYWPGGAPALAGAANQLYLNQLTELGIHLTQVTPRCSVGPGGGLPARPTRIRVSLCERGGLPRLSVRLALARGFPLSKVWA